MRLFLLLCYLSTSPLYAQKSTDSTTASSGFFSGLSKIHQRNSNAAQFSPGALAFCDYSGLGIDASLLYPDLGIAIYYLSANWKYKKQQFACSNRYVGLSEYRDWTGSIVYSRLFGKTTGIGLKFTLQRMNIPGISSKLIFNSTLGLQQEIGRSTRISAVIENLIPIKMEAYSDERVPTTFRLGGQFKVAKTCWIQTEFAKNLTDPAVWLFDIIYQPHQHWTVIIGGGMVPAQLLVGAGFYTRIFTIQLNGIWKSSAGLQYSCSMIFPFKSIPKQSVKSWDAY